MNFAIIGASGNVGRKTIEILEKSKIPFKELFLVASAKSAGKKIKFRDKEIEIIDLEKYDFSKAKITFFAAGSQIAKEWAHKAAKNTIVISNPEEAKNLKRIRKAGIVSQSTQAIENVQEIISILMTKIFDLRFVNTICYPTKRNQEQIKDLAKIVDIMIIIGSFTSANSKRLTSLSKDLNNNTYQVTDEQELDEKWFHNCKTVGISAGASTPDYLIKNIKNKIERIGKEI